MHLILTVYLTGVIRVIAKSNKPIHRRDAIVFQIAYVCRIIPSTRAKQLLKRSPSQSDIWIDILEDLSSFL